MYFTYQKYYHTTSSQMFDTDNKKNIILNPSWNNSYNVNVTFQKELQNVVWEPSIYLLIKWWTRDNFVNGHLVRDMVV